MSRTTFLIPSLVEHLDVEEGQMEGAGFQKGVELTQRYSSHLYLSFLYYCFTHCYCCADIWRVSKALAALPWWRPWLPWWWPFPWWVLWWQRLREHGAGWLWKHGHRWPWKFVSSPRRVVWERLIVDSIQAHPTILAGVVVFYHMHDASLTVQQINGTYHHVTWLRLV
jgi:hypothetical protein